MNLLNEFESFEHTCDEQNVELFALGKNGRGGVNNRARKVRQARDLVQSELDEIAETAKAIRKYKFDALQSRKGKVGAPGKKRPAYSGGRLGLNTKEHGMLLYLSDAGQNNPSTDTTFEKLAVMYQILFSNKRLLDTEERMATSAKSRRPPGGKHPVKFAVSPVSEEDVLRAFRRLDFSQDEWEWFDPKNKQQPVGVTDDDKREYRIRSGIWRAPEDRNPRKREKTTIDEVAVDAMVASETTPLLLEGCEWDDDEGSTTDVSTPLSIMNVNVLVGTVPGRSARRSSKARVTDAKVLSDFVDVIEPEFAGVMIIPTIQVFVNAGDGVRVVDVMVGSILTPKPGSIVTIGGKPLEHARVIHKNDSEITLVVRGCGLGGSKKKKPSGGKGGKRKGTVSGKGAYNLKALKNELRDVAKGALRGALSGGGRALGGHAGEFLGNRSWGEGLGKMAGEKLSRLILGKGDYDINNRPMKNSLINPDSRSGTRAVFGNNYIDLYHREYFADVLSAGNSFVQTRYIINPGNYSMFPFASQMAVNYEEYEILGAIVTYNPEISNFVGSSLMGKVILAANENPYLPDFRNAVQMENSDSALTIRPDKDGLYGIECARPALTKYYVRRPDVVIPNGAIGQFDFGEFYVGVLTPGITSGQILGELYVTYHVRLSIPRLSPTITGYAHFTGGAGTTTVGTLNYTSDGLSTLLGVFGTAVMDNTGYILLPIIPQNTAFSVQVVGRTALATAAWLTVQCTNATNYNDFEDVSGNPDNLNVITAPSGASSVSTCIFVQYDFISSASGTACQVRVNPTSALGYSTIEVKICVINGTAITPVPGLG